MSFHFNRKKTDVTIIIPSFITVLYQKRFKKERKLRARIQQKLDAETKRRNQIEDALKASGAPAEALRLLSGKLLPTLDPSFSSSFGFP